MAAEHFNPLQNCFLEIDQVFSAINHRIKIKQKLNVGNDNALRQTLVKDTTHVWRTSKK